MEEQFILGVLAVTLGVVVGVLLFAPFVAFDYRRRGGFGALRFLLWAVAFLYAMGLWVYALLPLPSADAIGCAGVNVDVTALVHDVRRAIAQGAAVQALAVPVALNALLFVPLGFFLRVLGGQGVVIALIAGLGVSGVIEVTQLTGVWGLYPCAYRVFDIDDLLMNTLGAVLGSVLALALPRRYLASLRLPETDLPAPVTRSRRLFGMACDALTAWVLALSVVVAVQSVLSMLGADAAVREGSAARVVGGTVPILVWLVITLATGATAGDHAARLRFTGGELPIGLARFLRLVGGIGGYLALIALPGAWGFVAAVFAVVSILLVFTTDDRGGLPGLASGQRLVDARGREPDTAPPADLEG